MGALRGLHVQFRPVEAQDSRLAERGRASQVLGLVDSLLDDRAVLRRDQVEDVAADDLLGAGGVEERRGRGVHIDVPPVAVDRDALGRELHQAAVPLLALTQGLFAPLHIPEQQ